MSKLLIDERPLTVLPSLVREVGMERAVILQQIHWLSGIPNSGVEHEGHHWVWGSYEEWCEEYFPFWSADSLRKHIIKLEQNGFVFSAQIKGFNRVKAYRINREKIAKIDAAMREDVPTSKRKIVRKPMREDVTASMPEDVTGSKREDIPACYITETSTETTKEKQEDDLPPPLVSDPQGVADHLAREAVHAAWRDQYGEPMPANLIASIDGLTVECGSAAVIHGIAASFTSQSRNFQYIAKCARNYVPPATSGQKLPSDYAVALPPAAIPRDPPPRPVAPRPPLPRAQDNPWAICLAELLPALQGSAQAWLTDSTLAAAGDVQGVPLYRVTVATQHAAGVQWLTKQAGVAIRRTLGSVLGRPVLVEIVAASATSEVAA